MKDAAPSVAGLYQRMFLVVGERIKTYDDRRLPFTEVCVAPEKSPTIDGPDRPEQNTFFWPQIGGTAKLAWTLHGLDHERRPVRAAHPADLGRRALRRRRSWSTRSTRADPTRRSSRHGQKVAFTPVRGRRRHDGAGTSTQVRGRGRRPALPTAPAQGEGRAPRRAGALGDRPGRPSEYADAYVKPAASARRPGNAGEVWAELADPVDARLRLRPAVGQRQGRRVHAAQPPGRRACPRHRHGRRRRRHGDRGASTRAAFLGRRPPEAVRAGAAHRPPARGRARPAKVPNVVSEAVDRIEGFLADLDRAGHAPSRPSPTPSGSSTGPPARRPTTSPRPQAALTDGRSRWRPRSTAAATDVKDAILSLPNATRRPSRPRSSTRRAACSTSAAATPSTRSRTVAPKLPPLVRNRLDALAKLLRTVLDAADLIDDIVRFVNGFDPSSLQSAIPLRVAAGDRVWPSAAHPFLGINEPILIFKPEGPGPRDNLVLAVDGRASGKGEMRRRGPGRAARLRPPPAARRAAGALRLRPPVVQDRLVRQGRGRRRPRRHRVPRHPRLRRDAQGADPVRRVLRPAVPRGQPGGHRRPASRLALPNVAIGVFTLSNISLGADVSVPFLGKAVTVGFNFCTRERPFTLPVTFLGGGGWFLIRLSPDGLDVLELGLEAGATLSVDFGVASGSISAMIGVYIRLEGDERLAHRLLPPAGRGRRARPDLGVDRAVPRARLRLRHRQDDRPGHAHRSRSRCSSSPAR